MCRAMFRLSLAALVVDLVVCGDNAAKGEHWAIWVLAGQLVAVVATGLLYARDEM